MLLMCLAYSFDYVLANFLFFYFSVSCIESVIQNFNILNGKLKVSIFN